MKRLALLLLLALAVVGCASRNANDADKLPAVEWRDQQEALDILARRADAIETVTSEGLITLTRPDGESVRFDLAMVRHKSDGVRLRAWKLGRAVFDLTMTPEGVWLLTPDDPSLKQKVRTAGVSARQLVETWKTFNGELFRARDGKLTEAGKNLIYTTKQRDAVTVRCEIDRRSLTPRRYLMCDDKGVTRFTLDVSDYRDIAGQLFPHRYVATSSEGKILITLREVELNTELAPNALRPPRRAEKLP
jgi:outer membrane lipoprotein-sorting protein